MVISPLLLALAILPAMPIVEDDAVLAEGRKLLDGQHAPAAIEHLDAALSAGTSDERAVRLLLSEARLLNAEPELALEVLAGLDWESDYEVALAMGRAQAAWAGWQQSPEDAQFVVMDAISYLERAVELAPAGDHRARVDVGFLYLDSLQDHQTATQLADEGLATDPEQGELLFLRGAAGTYTYWNAYQTGDEEATKAAMEASVTDLLAAVDRMPRDQVGPWVRLQWLYKTNG